MIVNIYTPTYYRLKKTQVALSSIIKSIENSRHDVILFVGDNNSQEEGMQDWLKEIARHPQVQLFNSAKNVGKAHIINQMHKQTRPCDYFVSIDSDMLVEEEDKYNWIDELVSIMNTPAGVRFGVLSVFQKGNNSHLWDALPHRVTYGKHELSHGNFGGVAGGCVMIKNSDFIKIGRYQVYDIYNGDDAFLMRNIYKTARKDIAVVNTVRLTHMENEIEEEAYQAWKIAKCHGNLGRGFEGYYENKEKSV